MSREEIRHIDKTCCSAESPVDHGTTDWLTGQKSLCPLHEIQEIPAFLLGNRLIVPGSTAVSISLCVEVGGWKTPFSQ